MAKTKLSELCLEIAWVRPSDGILCTKLRHADNEHSSRYESFGGRGGGNLHDNPDLMFMFAQNLCEYEDDITPGGVSNG